jgi:FkbM family methyltransferase
MNNSIKYWDEKIVSRHIGMEIKWLIDYLTEKNISEISYIDIGGNVGKFYDELSEKYHIKKCVIVEASKRLSEYMVEKFKNIDSITVYNFGISDSEGEYHFDDSGIDFWADRELNEDINLGVSKMSNRPGETPFIKMDKFLTEFNTIPSNEITFIKIDTENRDIPIVGDMMEYLKINNIRPFILFENNFHNDMSMEDAQKIVDNFCEVLNYEKVDLNINGDKFIKPII